MPRRSASSAAPRTTSARLPQIGLALLVAGLLAGSGAATASAGTRSAAEAGTTPVLTSTITDPPSGPGDAAESGSVVEDGVVADFAARPGGGGDLTSSETKDAPLSLASDSAHVTGSALPWVLGVLALAVVTGAVRSYVRSPQRQAARATRLSR
jgi:hypothetical protein